MPRLLAKHRTEIAYAGPVAESINELHLTPRGDGHQKVEWTRVFTVPPTELREHVDAFGNLVHWFQLDQPHDLLVVEAEALVETRPAPALADRPVSWSAVAGDDYREEYAEFLAPSAHVRWPRPVVAMRGRMDLPDHSEPLGPWLIALESEVNRLIAYTPGATMVDTPIEEVVRQRRGVCQDMAQLMIALCRASGVAARYVSGWLHLPGHEGPAESHAWLEAALPGLGWRDYDPTHPRPAWEHYVRLAVGRDYTDVPPLRGSYTGPPTDDLRVTVAIRELP